MSLVIGFAFLLTLAGMKRAGLRATSVSHDTKLDAGTKRSKTH
jgi:hypothetical protein